MNTSLDVSLILKIDSDPSICQPSPTHPPRLCFLLIQCNVHWGGHLGVPPETVLMSELFISVENSFTCKKFILMCLSRHSLREKGAALIIAKEKCSIIHHLVRFLWLISPNSVLILSRTNRIPSRPIIRKHISREGLGSEPLIYFYPDRNCILTGSFGCLLSVLPEFGQRTR